MYWIIVKTEDGFKAYPAEDETMAKQVKEIALAGRGENKFWITKQIQVLGFFEEEKEVRT